MRVCLFRGVEVGKFCSDVLMLEESFGDINLGLEPLYSVLDADLRALQCLSVNSLSVCVESSPAYDL